MGSLRNVHDTTFDEPMKHPALGQENAAIVPRGLELGNCRTGRRSQPPVERFVEAPKRRTIERQTLLIIRESGVGGAHRIRRFDATPLPGPPQAGGPAEVEREPIARTRKAEYGDAGHKEEHQKAPTKGWSLNRHRNRPNHPQKEENGAEAQRDG